MKYGFHWLIKSEIAGSSRPQSLAEIETWRSRGILAVISLVEDRIALDGFDVLHLPVPDLTPPALAQLETACRFIDRQRSAARPLVVHCLAGKGRTGTVLAAWLIFHGVECAAAIERVRASSEGSIETTAQEAALSEFERRLI